MSSRTRWERNIRPWGGGLKSKGKGQLIVETRDASRERGGRLERSPIQGPFLEREKPQTTPHPFQAHVYQGPLALCRNPNKLGLT